MRRITPPDKLLVNFRAFIFLLRIFAFKNGATTFSEIATAAYPTTPKVVALLRRHKHVRLTYPIAQENSYTSVRAGRNVNAANEKAGPKQNVERAGKSHDRTQEKAGRLDGRLEIKVKAL
jgi:hypothetical protein